MLGVSTGWEPDGILGKDEFINVGTLILAINAKGVEAAMRAAYRAAGDLDFPRDRQLSEGDEAPCDWREHVKALRQEDGSFNEAGAWEVEIARIGFARSPEGGEYDSDVLIVRADFYGCEPREKPDAEDDSGYWAAEKERRALQRSIRAAPRSKARRSWSL